MLRKKVFLQVKKGLKLQEEKRNVAQAEQLASLQVCGNYTHNDTKRACFGVFISVPSLSQQMAALSIITSR
jgi:hypothetical protein